MLPVSSPGGAASWICQAALLAVVTVVTARAAVGGMMQAAAAAAATVKSPALRSRALAGEGEDVIGDPSVQGVGTVTLGAWRFRPSAKRFPPDLTG